MTTTGAFGLIENVGTVLLDTVTELDAATEAGTADGVAGAEEALDLPP